MEWPGLDFPRRLLEGSPLAGRLEPSQVLLPIEPECQGKGEALSEGVELMGQSATDFIDTIEKDRRPAKNTEEAWSATMHEVREGQSSDHAPRHVVWQGAKWRPIVDEKRLGTNALCIPPELTLIFARSRTMRLHKMCGHIPYWLMPTSSLVQGPCRPCGGSGQRAPVRPAVVQPVEWAYFLASARR